MDEYVNIIWYDENPQDSIQDLLNTIHYHVILCKSIEILSKTIDKDIHELHKILLILSGKMNHELVLSTVHDERRIVSIFIYNESLNISFEKYTKICGLFTSYESLEKKLLMQARILNHQATALSFDERSNEKSMEELIENPEVVLFDAHSRFSSKQFITFAEREKMLKYCRRRYASNSKQLQLIDLFDETYNATDAIRWYSKDCFLFSLLNKCMRKQSGNVYDCDMVYFAVDLSVQIQSEWKKQQEQNKKDGNVKPFHVYRGLSLPDVEIARIQEYKGKSVTIKGFLSTTKSFAVAHMFAANVVFDIIIEPKLDNIIYADISKCSCIPDEEEILIDFGTTFQISDIEFEDICNLWIVTLLSINENDKIIDAFIDVKRSQGEDDLLIARELVFFGYKERGCQLLQNLIKSTDDIIDKYECYVELGEINTQSEDFMHAANYYQEAYNLCALFYPNNHRLNIAAFYLSTIYACLNDYEQAFKHLVIQIDFPEPDLYSIKRCYFKSWDVLVTNEETLNFEPIQNAYQYLQNNLNIFQNDEDICCKIHFYLGLILLKIHRRAISLEPLQESLVHFEASKLLSENKYSHIHIWYYYFMGIIYESTSDYNKAKNYYRKIFRSQTNGFNSHELRTIIHLRIASCYAGQKKYKAAIKGHARALQESLLTGKSILIGQVKAHIGITHLQFRRYARAIEQFIDIRTFLFEIKMPFNRQLNLIIGEAFIKINDIHQAIKSYSEYLNFHENIYEDRLNLCCTVCERIIGLYISIKQPNDTIQYAKKLIDYRLQDYSVDFILVKDAQLLLGLCYQMTKEYQQSIDYYKIAYDTLSKISINDFEADYNPMISDDAVTIQSTIATLYRRLTDYKQAIYHAEMALDTEKKRLSRNKITIITYYDFIGWCYYKMNEYDKSREIATKGLHLLHMYALKINPQYCSIYHTLGNACLELGDLEQAYIYCMKGLFILFTNPEFQSEKYLLESFYSLLHTIRQRANDTFETLTSLPILFENSEGQDCDNYNIQSIIKFIRPEIIHDNVDPTEYIHNIEFSKTQLMPDPLFQDTTRGLLIDAFLKQ